MSAAAKCRFVCIQVSVHSSFSKFAFMNNYCTKNLVDQVYFCIADPEKICADKQHFAMLVHSKLLWHVMTIKVAGGVFNIHEIHQLFSVNIDRPACNE